MHQTAVVDDVVNSMALALLIEQDPRLEVSGLYRNIAEAFGARTRETGVGKPDAVAFDTDPSAQLNTIRKRRAAWPDAVLALYTFKPTGASALRKAGVDLECDKSDGARVFLDDLISHLQSSQRRRA